MSNAVTSALMFLAGMGIPLMAALNADLGTRLQSALAAVAVLCSVALTVTLMIIALRPRPNWQALASVPPASFAAGGLFVLYIASITWAAPRIGLGQAVLIVLVGQLISSALIDHFGLWNALPSPISSRRALGILLILAGAILTQKNAIILSST